MTEKDWSHLRHHKHLKISALEAFHRDSAYPRHSHDYYVIAVVDSGQQSFLHGGTRYKTGVDGLILLNPGEAHTGEPLDQQGYVYRAFYPTAEHMQTVAVETGMPGARVPMFAAPRADDLQMASWIRALVDTLQTDGDALESETRLVCTLVELVKRFGDQMPHAQKSGVEHAAVRTICDYIDAHYAQPITLAQLAELVNFSRYYLLHTFRKATGMPPHLYLESVRVRHAQRLLMEGHPPADVAQQVGFASQSHLTRRFKQIISVTPGAYARQLRDT